MDTPFVFGKIADGEDFTDRTVDTEKLKNNFCPWSGFQG